MAEYITIDSGTTNTRISLMSEGKQIHTLTFPVGATKDIEDKTLLAKTLKQGIADLLKETRRTEKDIRCILACGMITSEFGLVELPHIQIPAGMRELSEAAEERRIEAITSIPFVFFRGVKTLCTDVANADMMRGEECELMGIFQGEGTYVLSGSHTKIVRMDNLGRIVDFRTMLTGEMISAIANNTILKDSVELREISPNREWLNEGFEYASAHGINEALFKVRVLKNLFKKSPEEVYNFYLGVLLSEEISCILSRKPDRIVLGGAKALKQALAVLLSERDESNVTVLTDEQVKQSLSIGMIKLYEMKKN